MCNKSGNQNEIYYFEQCVWPEMETSVWSIGKRYERFFHTTETHLKQNELVRYTFNKFISMNASTLADNDEKLLTDSISHHIDHRTIKHQNCWCHIIKQFVTKY